MREYNIKINNDGSVSVHSSPQYIDEHNATMLIIELNDELKAPNINYHTLCFNTGVLSDNPYRIKLIGDMITEDTANGYIDSGTIYFPLPAALTACKSLGVQVQAHILDNTGKVRETLKSPVFYLDFEISVSGEEEFISYSDSSFISAIHDTLSQMNETTQEADALCEKINSAFENGEMNGTTFFPEISENGELTWTNDGGFDNPPSFLIKGEPGTNATINGYEAITLTAGENIMLEQNEGKELSISTAFANQNTLSKFHCETAQGEGDAFHITTELYPNLVKFNGRYLREVDHGRVIQSVHKVTKDGKSCLRMTFDRVTPSFNLSPDDPNGENEHYDFVDFPVIDIEQKEDSDNNLVLNGGQLDLGVGNYAPMSKMSVSAGELNILNPNTAYVFSECSALNIMLADGAENKLNEYIFSFISGETPTVLTLPSDIVWANELTVEANKRYEISIVGNVALWSATNIEVTA